MDIESNGKSINKEAPQVRRFFPQTNPEN